MSAAAALIKTRRRRRVLLTACCVKRRSDKHGAAVVTATLWITLGFTLEWGNEAWLEMIDSLMGNFSLQTDCLADVKPVRKTASGWRPIYSNRKGCDFPFMQHKSGRRCEGVCLLQTETSS